MNKKYLYLLPLFSLAVAGTTYAGNPDRQGEAGAYELLINPWARSAGLHTMNTSSVSGAEAIQINVAGLCRVDKTQAMFGHTRYLVGADVNLNAFGLAQKVGKHGAFGVQLMGVDFGDIPVTTTLTPEGDGSTFSPSFFNIALSYAHMFENKVSVGVTVKSINESVANASARAVALDAGVQYVTGEKDNFKLGISLRNVGNKMRFTGDGLSQQTPNPDGTFSYPLTYNNRGAGYELPSQLNIGTSYDWILGKENRLSLIGNFTSNSFSRDNVGTALELSVGKMFSLRTGYKFEFGTNKKTTDPRAIDPSVDNGVSAGLSFNLPLKKGSSSRLGFDYAYQQTSIWQGIHSFSLRIDL